MEQPVNRFYFPGNYSFGSMVCRMHAIEKEIVGLLYSLCLTILKLEAVNAKKDVLVTILSHCWLKIETVAIAVVRWLVHNGTPGFILCSSSKAKTIRMQNPTTFYSNFLFIQQTKWMCVVILISDLPPSKSCSIYHHSPFRLFFLSIYFGPIVFGGAFVILVAFFVCVWMSMCLVSSTPLFYF